MLDGIKQLLPPHLSSLPYSDRETALYTWKLGLPEHTPLPPCSLCGRQKSWDQTRVGFCPDMPHLWGTPLAVVWVTIHTPSVVSQSMPCISFDACSATADCMIFHDANALQALLQCPSHLSYVYLLKLALGKGCPGVVHIPLAEGGLGSISGKCSLLHISITKLATVTDTGEPIAVRKDCWYASPLRDK